MKAPTGKPILGAILGFFIGVIAVLILQQAGLLAPTRLVAFGIVGLAMAACSLFLTIRFTAVTFVIVQTLSIAVIAWGLLGIAQHGAPGTLTGGCTLTATSTYPDVATPQTTSARDPFVVDPDGSVSWSGTTPTGLMGWTTNLGIQFGGVNIPVWSGSDQNTEGLTEHIGTVSVAEYVDDLESYVGLSLSGIYPVTGDISIDGAKVCEMTGYVLIPSGGLFSGTALIILWVLLTILVVIMIVMMVRVMMARGAYKAALAGGAGTAGAAAAAGVEAAKADDAAAGEAASKPESGATKTTGSTKTSGSTKTTPAKTGTSKTTASGASAAKKPAAKKPPAAKPPADS